MKINLMSFGYAYGIPMEADMVLDVRFLPNPFFTEGLRRKRGFPARLASFFKSHDVYRNIFFCFPIFGVPYTFVRE